MFCLIESNISSYLVCLFSLFSGCTEFTARKTSNSSRCQSRPRPWTLGNSHTVPMTTCRHRTVLVSPFHLIKFVFFPSGTNVPWFFVSYVFLLDTGLEVFVWRGANATLSGTTKARYFCHLLEKLQIPGKVTCTVMDIIIYRWIFFYLFFFVEFIDDLYPWRHLAAKQEQMGF